MQSVSTAWKTAQEQTLVPESFVEVTLQIGDPDAQADAVPSDNGHEGYSSTEHLADETEKDQIKLATLEHNIWVLDGSCEVLPDDPPYGNNGFIGNVLSDDTCAFDVTPTITISFSSVFSAAIPGITITWAPAYGEWATSYRLTAYNGETQVAQVSVTDNNSISSVITEDIQNYNKITIEVLKWSLPSRRARIESVLLGVEKVYGKSELMSFSHDMSVDPMSAELPKSEITFEITNLNGEYNPDNPQGVEKYLMERQSITARYGYKINGSIEWIKAGTFFMSEWETPQNGITATFTARDSLEYMSDTYEGTTTGTLADIATAAFQQAELPTMPDGSNRWQIDASLSSITVPDSVDFGESSIAEVLQYVANAACCVFYQDREGMIHIEPLAAGTTDYEINRFRSYSNSEISLTKQLKAVNINDGTAVLTVGDVGETQDVDNPLISEDRAQTVAQWVADYLENRKILSGDFRADPRLDPLDRVTNENQFAESVVLVTEIQYTYNGAFRGSYEGRSGV